MFFVFSLVGLKRILFVDSQWENFKLSGLVRLVYPREVELF